MRRSEIVIDLEHRPLRGRGWFWRVTAPRHYERTGGYALTKKAARRRARRAAERIWRHEAEKLTETYTLADEGVDGGDQ